MIYTHKLNLPILLLLGFLLWGSCNKKSPNITIESQNKLLVYPNPCSEYCFIYLNNSSGQGYTLTVIDTRGKELIKVENPSSSQITVDLSKESNGKYIAALSNGSETYTETFYKYK